MSEQPHPLEIARLWIYTEAALIERHIVYQKSLPILCTVSTNCGIRHDVWFSSLSAVAAFCQEMKPPDVLAICGPGESADVIYDLLHGLQCGANIH